MITVDHETEFTSLALDEWAHVNRVTMSLTRPGKPTDNALCESLNGRLRDECLNIHEFKKIEDARQIVEAWRCDYNEHRPQCSLKNLTPNELKYEVRKPDNE
jgi:putative transposase